MIVALAFCASIGILQDVQGAYDSHGKRNPFLPPSQAVSSRTAAAVDTGSLEKWFSKSLGGILWDTQEPHALLGDKIISVGDEVRGCTIREIRPDGIVFQYMGKNVEVPLAIEKKEKGRDED